MGKLKKKGHNARRSQAKNEGAEEDAHSQDGTAPSAASASVPEQSLPQPLETEETEESESLHKHMAEDPEKGPTAGEARAGGARVGQSDESSGSPQGAEFAEGIIEHVQLLASLIDGEDLSRQETIEFLRQIMRQRSIAKESAIDYVLGQIKQKPP